MGPATSVRLSAVNSSARVEGFVPSTSSCTSSARSPTTSSGTVSRCSEPICSTRRRVGVHSTACTRSCTSPRSSAIPRARSTRSARRRSTSTRLAPSSRMRPRRCRAFRVRVDVLELRAMTDSSVPVDEQGELAPVSLYARQKVEVEQWLLGRSNGALSPDLPAVRDRLRGRAADALRPDRQRVHARHVGRARARGLRRALLATVRPRTRRGARRPARARLAPRARARRGLQRRELGSELPQARPRRDHRRAVPARRGRFVEHARIHATTRWTSRRSSGCWASS